jgi:membrane protein
MLKESFSHWLEDEASCLGASLAFYTLLSLSPLLILIVGIAGMAFGRSSAQAQLIDQLRQLVGAEGAKAIEIILQSAQRPASGIVAGGVGFLVLLFGASGVFSELRAALNRIWHIKPTPTSGLRSLLRERVFSFGLVLAVGFLLLVSLVISAVIAGLTTFARDIFPVPPIVFEIANTFVSLAITTSIFALMFKYLPDTKIVTRQVWPGALVTAILFTIGRVLIGLYLGKASVGSAYGAAGSVVALIVWVYYSAQIFFLGAEFTRVYAKSGVEPALPRQPEAIDPAAAARSV